MSVQLLTRGRPVMLNKLIRVAVIITAITGIVYVLSWLYIIAGAYSLVDRIR